MLGAVRLAKGCFAARGSLSNCGSYGGFSFGAPTGRLLPPFAYFGPTKLCVIHISHSTAIKLQVCLLLFPFYKRGTNVLFLSQKEKGTKKKLASVPLERYRAWELYPANPDKPLRKSLRCAQNSLLAETVGTVSDAVGYSGSFDLVEAFLLVRRRDGYSPPFAYFSPTKFGRERRSATAVKAHWGLNKSAGISATPSAKKPSDALGSRKEQINVRNRPQRFRQAISAERSEGYRAEFYLALPLRSELPHKQALKRHACQLLFVTCSFGERKS